MFFFKHMVLSSLLVSTTPLFVGRRFIHLCRFKSTEGYRLGSRGEGGKISTTSLFARQSGQGMKTKGNQQSTPEKLGRGMVPKYVPKSENQRKYVNALDNPEIPLIFVLGPAGTGKTLFACLTAIQGLRSGEFDRIILTRPLVTVEEELGFLPGNIKSKMDPWTRPIFDIFLEYYSQKDIDAMLNAGLIEIAPLAFMRGRTFKRCFILADEMQNSSPAQMLMAATRIGFGSKMVVNGDLNQSDRGAENGLAVMIRKVRAAILRDNHPTIESSPELKHKKISGISICDLETDDIERSPIVSTILQIMTPQELGPSEHLRCSRLRSEEPLTLGVGGSSDLVVTTRKHTNLLDAALIPRKDMIRTQNTGVNHELES